MLTEIRRWYAYARWANEQMLAACRTVEPDVLLRSDGSSFGSIIGTLEHLYGADHVWLERFLGASPTAFHLQGTFRHVDDAERAWATLYPRRDAWLASLSESRLAQPLTYKNMKGEPFENPIGELLYHVANHATYHRGQVMQAVRQAGGTVTSTDYIFWLRIPPAA